MNVATAPHAMLVVIGGAVYFPCYVQCVQAYITAANGALCRDVPVWLSSVICWVFLIFFFHSTKQGLQTSVTCDTKRVCCGSWRDAHARRPVFFSESVHSSQVDAKHVEVWPFSPFWFQITAIFIGFSLGLAHISFPKQKKCFSLSVLALIANVTKVPYATGTKTFLTEELVHPARPWKFFPSPQLKRNGERLRGIYS